MVRNLNLTIDINQDGFEVDILEPESGDVKRIKNVFSPDEHPEFNEQIGNEIYSWISMWEDEMEER